MNDEEIIKLFEARDEKGISAAGERYGKLLRSVARGILRSEQDAEECESEALLRAWNSIPPARPERLCAYLCRIARRLALDRYDYNNADKRRAETLPIEELAEYRRLRGRGGQALRAGAYRSAERIPPRAG